MAKRKRDRQEDEPAGAEVVGSEAYAWHFDMLHDDARTKAFADAFGRLPAAALGGVALDIGCGSGLLGLALLQSCPEVSHVVSFESDAALAAVARENAQKAPCSSKMSVHACRSTSVDSLGELQGIPQGLQRARLVVAEILDAGLLGEDCLKTLRHASRHLLAPSYFAVPASADVYACLVESATLASWQHLSGNPLMPAQYFEDDGDGNPHDVALQRLLLAGEAKVLSAEFRAMSVDFETLPPEAGASMVLQVEVTQSGRLDAVAFWWQCRMVRGDASAALTNAPPWAPSSSHLAGRAEVDHWRQSVCILPRPARQVERGQVIRCAAMHNDDDIWFRILDEGGIPPSPHEVPRAVSRLCQWSHTRIWQLASQHRMQALQQAMDQALGGLALKPWHDFAGALVLDISDGPLLGVAALRALARVQRATRRRRGDPASKRLRSLLHLSGRRPTVMCLESSREDLLTARDIASPWLAKCAKRWGGPTLQLVLGSPSLAPGSVAVLCAEPYARVCEGQACDAQLWQHWAQVDALRWSLAEKAVLLPRAFRVRAALVACPELWRRRQPITAPVCGVDVAAINHLHPEAGRPGKESTSAKRFRERFPCSLWQVSHTLVSNPETLCSVQLEAEFPDRPRRFPGASLEVTTADLGVHAVATWTEVEIREGHWLTGAAIGRLPNGGASVGAAAFLPSPDMQGVLLARRPRESASSEGSVAVQARFDPGDGTLRMRASWEGGEAF